MLASLKFLRTPVFIEQRISTVGLKAFFSAVNNSNLSGAISFDETETAFRGKTTLELIRAYVSIYFLLSWDLRIGAVFTER